MIYKGFYNIEGGEFESHHLSLIYYKGGGKGPLIHLIAKMQLPLKTNE
jgi:hypothetical protein